MFFSPLKTAKLALPILILILAPSTYGQTRITKTIDFEAIQVGDDGVLNGKDVNGANFIEVDAFRFSTTYNADWDISENFAITNHSDILDGTYTNLYSSNVGTGASNSRNYAVAYMNSELHNSSIGSAADLWLLPSISIPDTAQIQSLELSNTTYTTGTIVNGNFSGRPFMLGDYFELSIYGLDENDNILEPVSFRLADYTSVSEDGKGFILSEWETLDLQALSNATSLHFKLTTTDAGEFWPNTPLNFAIDNLTYSVSAIPEPSSLVLCSVLAVNAGLVWRRKRTRKFCDSSPSPEIPNHELVVKSV